MDDPSRGLIVGQRVAAAKLERAPAMRRRATAEEERLWQALRRPVWQGPPFRRQQVIDGFIADFYCHDARLIVEVDGNVHVPQADHDRERDRVLRARGLSVLRVADADIRNRLPATLERISEHCQRVGDLSP